MGHWVCYTVLTVQHYQCPMDTEVTISRIIEITGCGIMSVSHTPNQALLRTLEMLNSGLRPSFNISQCSQLSLVLGMGH